MSFNKAKTIVLVTGANRGIGFETVKALLQVERPSPGDTKSAVNGAPYHVYLGCRDIKKGQTAVDSLQPEHGNSVSAIPLDVLSSESIAAAVSCVREEAGRIDVLINNAGIIPQDVSAMARLRSAFEMNTVAVWAVTEAFRPLLLAQPGGAQPKAKRVINVTSGLGSVSLRYAADHKWYNVSDPEYRISKAALDQMTACQAYDLRGQAKVFAFCPGWCATGLTHTPEERKAWGAQDPRIPGMELTKVVEGGRDRDIGHMLEVGGTMPW